LCFINMMRQGHQLISYPLLFAPNGKDNNVQPCLHQYIC
jgi:hypothetical protein